METEGDAQLNLHWEGGPPAWVSSNSTLSLLPRAVRVCELTSVCGQKKLTTRGQGVHSIFWNQLQLASGPDERSLESYAIWPVRDLEWELQLVIEQVSTWPCLLHLSP